MLSCHALIEQNGATCLAIPFERSTAGNRGTSSSNLPYVNVSQRDGDICVDRDVCALRGLLENKQ